jgi:hypothetical protein
VAAAPAWTIAEAVAQFTWNAATTFEMRVLTLQELREVVGGDVDREIKNGGGGVGGD